MAESEAHDPFEDFNRAMGQGAVRNPYPGYAELRAKGPVHKLDFKQMVAEMGGDTSSTNDITPPDTLQIYTVVSHASVAQVLLDGKTFSSGAYAASMGMVMGRTILQMDEPEHSRYRGLIQQAFTRKALERWGRDVIAPTINRYVDRFAERGSGDLVRELTFPFPVEVIARMIGLDEDLHAEFHRRAIELISVGFDWERGIAASKRLAQMFQPVIHDRREQPREDLISALAHAELDGTRLTDEEIYAFLRLLAPAGAETTYRSSSNLLFGLLTHPDQLDAVLDDRSLIPRAIEEGLRWECPLTGIMRMATTDTKVCGVVIPAGAVVQVNMGAANHDETRYDDPESFDIFREPKQHMAFAYGAHRCLGMHLARSETQLLLETLFDRLPNLRLDPAADDVHITGQGFRSPRSLPVLFDA